MAGWISSKLKVAETLLQQIDQQAAESLRKGEKSRSDELELESPSRSGNGGGIAPPLKDQLKKKVESNSSHGNHSENLRGSSKHQKLQEGNRKGNKAIGNSNSSASSNKSGGVDTDWTQLLNIPDQTRTSAPPFSSSGLRRDGRRPGTLGLSALEGKRVNQGNGSASNKLLSETEVVGKNKFDGVVLDQRLTDGEESSFSTSAIVRLDSGACDGNNVIEHKTNRNDNEKVGGYKNQDLNGFKDIVLQGGKSEAKNFPVSANGGNSSAKSSVAVDMTSVIKMLSSSSHTKLENLEKRVEDSNASSTSLSFNDLKKVPSSISVEEDDDGSDSDTDSGSSSDSESERERVERRRRRQQILAEKAAAKAALTIKDQEDIVARLEGEKQSLEKILEDRAKQHVQEASELQTNMMETMEAVELEKQKHNNTRMEALARLSKLETENAELARSLAAAQWNLEVEVNQVADIRQQIEEKEIAHEELRRRILNRNQSEISLNQLQLRASKGVEFEREMQEVEYSFITDKIGRLQEKAKILEANIESTVKDMESPTEVELQLKRRLGQLTDHLIQKQAQVEGLTSEKATLLFRIEAISRTLEENNSLLNLTDSRIDIESGTWYFSKLKGRPFQDKMRSGQQQLGSLLKQLDAIFSAGAAFLRRNPTARWWSLAYLICLHFWVVYILTSHTQTSGDAKSGAVISLENINNTGGV